MDIFIYISYIHFPVLICHTFYSYQAPVPLSVVTIFGIQSKLHMPVSSVSQPQADDIPQSWAPLPGQTASEDPARSPALWKHSQSYRSSMYVSGPMWDQAWQFEFS